MTDVLAQVTQALLDDIISTDLLAYNLSSRVTKDYESARDHQVSTGAYSDMLLSLRAASRKYSPDEREMLPEGVEIYVGLTASKIRAGKAWIGDLLANSQDRPFALSPTPIPSLPEDIKKAIAAMLMEEVRRMEMPPEQALNSEDLRKMATSFKVLGLRYADRIAEEYTGRMETVIADQLAESGWRDVMQGFIQDVLTYPMGAIEGPLFRKKQKLVWVNNQMIEQEQLVMEFKRVSPFNLLQSADSLDTQTGDYTIVIDKSTPSQLYGMIGTDDGVQDEQVRLCIEMYGESGFALQNQSEKDALEGTDQSTRSSTTIDVIRRYGRISGKFLADYITVPDEARYYETIIYVAGKYVLYAAINNYPLKVRPVFRSSYQKISGKFIGEGLGLLLDEAQRLYNGAARALALNVAFLGEPMSEYDIERMEESADPSVLMPGKSYAVNTDIGAQQGPAIRLIKIPNSINEILAVMGYVKAMADELSGIPPYVMGGTPQGGVGRTLGGLTAMLGNAAKGIKDVIGNIERDVVEPIVTLLYNYNMINSENTTIKADAQVVARASQGIMQRESAQARSVETLQMLQPYLESGLIEPEGMKVLLREVLSSMGQPVDKIIPDPLREQQIKNTIDANAVSSEPRTPLPTLDGRSTSQMNGQLN